MSRKQKKLNPIKVVSNNEVSPEERDALEERRKQRETLANRVSQFTEITTPTVKEEAAPVMMRVEALWDGKETARLDPLERPLWDLDLLRIPYIWSHYGTRGEGITVHVLDSGINSLHPVFAGKDIMARSFLGDDCSDYTGHGTWVAGKIAGAGVGIAPRVSLRCARVLDDSGIGNSKFTNAALAAILAEGEADIVNLSLGSPQRCKEQEQLIWKLHKQGVLLVAAAGNRGSSTPFYPAAFDGVLTVGALDHKQSRASFSNYGTPLEVVAPGVSCYGPYLGSAYKRLQGTSMAAPIVSGVLALALSLIRLHKPEINKISRRNMALDALKATAQDLGPAGWDTEYGFGGLNTSALCNFLECALKKA